MATGRPSRTSRAASDTSAPEKGPVIVTRNGKPAAVLLAISDEEELERLVMAHSPRLQAILEAARGRIESGAGLREDEFWKGVEGVKGLKKPGGKRTRPA